MSNPPQIFISYAREDYRVVRKIYDRLKAAGYKPWMDKVDLLAGAAFDKAIPKVLRESDLFIVCLSPNSVNKRSFIQREINLALDILEEKLGDDLYIFPVRLDACVAPDRIAKFNWTDLFGEDHEEEWEKLLRSLQYQFARLGHIAPTPHIKEELVLPRSKSAQPESIVRPKLYMENLNGVPLEMIFVPTGKFTMGSSYSDNEAPLHEVNVPSFYIGKYQITQKQWQAVMGETPSFFEGDDLPVENISWSKGKEFCEKLSHLINKEYRLPNEAEWEYACCAGTVGDYAGNLNEMAWYRENSSHSVHPVGQKKPNLLGIYDMAGNVWEWCEDVWHDNYAGAPIDGSSWLGGENQERRVVRGGSWSTFDDFCRSASRRYVHQDNYSNEVGLRVVISARTP